MEPWDTPVSIGDHKGACPFKKTSWNLQVKKFLISFRGVPEIPVDQSLQINTLCQTLSKSLDIYKNIPLLHVMGKNQMLNKYHEIF